MNQRAAQENISLEDDYTPPTPEERGDIVVDEPLEEPLVEPQEDGDDALEEDGDDALEEDGDDESEEEDGDDESEEEDGDDESEEDVKKPTPKNKVPLTRLNKEVEKRRVAEQRAQELEERLAALESKSEPKEEAPSGFSKEDFHAMQEAMVDGETDKAFDIFQKLLGQKSSESMTKDELRAEVRAELEQERAVSELQSTAATLGEKYPELDSASEIADAGLIEEVVDLRNTFAERGMPLAKALERAVRIIAGEHQLEDRTAAPKIDTPPLKKPVDVKKKMQAAAKEKGPMRGAGDGKREALDIANMNVDDFDKISEEEKAKARGDYI